MRTTSRSAAVLLSLALAACGSHDNAPTPPGTGGAGTPHPVAPPSAPPAAPPPTAPPAAPPPTQVVSGQGSVVSRAPTPATGCPATDVAALTGPGTVHSGEVTANETWDMAGSPHRFPDGIEIRTGATVTVEPCTLILVGQGDKWVAVNTGGALVAEGQVGKPILFDAAPEAGPTQPGAWDGVYVQDGAGANTRFHHVVIEHAGNQVGQWMPAALHAQGSVALDVQDVKIENSQLGGVTLADQSKFAPGSTGLVVTHTGTADPYSPPVAISSPDAVATLPTGTYTGNNTDEIYVYDEHLRASGTWKNVGVRYRMETDLTIGSPSGATLTVEPGVTLAFNDGKALFVGYDDDGAVVLDGHADATRIVLTSSSIAPEGGAWAGLWFGDHVLRPLVKVSYVTIRFAGEENGYFGDACGGVARAGIWIGHDDLGPRIDHTKFDQLHADAVAILRHYGTAHPTDYSGSSLANDFTTMGAHCKQNVAQGADGSCPDNAVCH